MDSSKVPQDPSVFVPETTPKLERQLQALKNRLEGSEASLVVWEASAVKKLVVRIERVEKLIVESHALQEQAWKRSRGELAWQYGTGPEVRVSRVVTYGRKTGVPHFGFHVVHKATPSTGVPAQTENPVKQFRRRYEQMFGKLSGRQWTRLRKSVKRAMREDVRDAMPEPT